MAKQENRATNFCYDGEDFPTLVFEEDKFEDEKETAKKYDPSQPRAPKGDKRGGQWIKGGTADYPNYDDGMIEWYWGNQLAPSVKKAVELAEKGKKLTDKEEFEMKDWTGDRYELINNYLRNGDPKDGFINEAGEELFHTTTIGSIKVLDGMMAKARLPEALTVYRGVSLLSWQKMGLTEGTMFSDAGYMSASLRTQIAGRAVGQTENLGLLEIRLPKGAKAISTAPYAGVFQNEAEIMINRKAKFKVLSVSANGTWGHKAVLEYVG
jgi:hypothetical protein